MPHGPGKLDSLEVTGTLAYTQSLSIPTLGRRPCPVPAGYGSRVTKRPAPFSVCSMI